MGKQGIGSFPWDVRGTAALLAGLLDALVFLEEYLDTWKSQTNNHYVLVISQTSTYSVGTFHTYCEVSGESAAECTREHCTYAVNHLM